jgi:hypothetical protein
MSPVFSAVVVLSAVAATAVLLAHWLIADGRRAGPGPVAPRRLPARRPPAPTVLAPVLSGDGAWLWTGSAWVPAWWAGVAVPPALRPSRSHGCTSALGVGCLVLLSVAAVIGVLVFVVLAGLAMALAGALGA